LLRPAESLLSDRDFWQHQSDGLVVFLSPNSSQAYRLPSGFDEFIGIAKNFHVKPLLPLLSRAGRFYILALSMNEVRLFLGNRDTIDEVELDDISTNMQEALWMDDPEKHADFHTGASSSGREGKRQAVFHGHGEKSATEKTNILRYFQHVDRGLNALLEEKDIPMVLAGVDYLLPIYHQASSYAGLLEEGLEGNPEELDGKELHKMAWDLVQPIFNEDQNQALERFEQLDGQGNEMASTDLEAVVKAANFGRVETLFVPLGVQKWGRFDPRQNQVLPEEHPNPDNEDLLDFAAMHTLFNSGKVYAVQPEKLPGAGELAAILRYAA
jgi:peptide subunit release factor 1 (eRF1)